MEKICLMSLNLHCGMEEDYESKFETIVDTIGKKNPDVIMLQECVQRIDETVITDHRGTQIKEDNQARALVVSLKDKYEMDYDYYFDWGNYGFEVYEEGMAILSKVEIHSTESKYMSRSSDVEEWKARKVIRIGTVISGKKVYFYNIHLGWWEDEDEPFIEQVEKLRDWLMEEPEADHIMAGDFNNPAGQEGYKHMTDNLGFRDLYFVANPDGFTDATFSRQDLSFEHEDDNDGERIDYIMTTNTDISPESVERIFTGADAQLVSDHYGLLAVLRLINS